VADDAYNGILSLPIFPSMTRGDVERVVGLLSGSVGSENNKRAVA
jgi:dTDP-4-amino-4,6-dideoxygalactose transaminase